MNDLALIHVCLRETRPYPKRFASREIWNRHSFIAVHVNFGVSDSVEGRRCCTLAAELDVRRLAPRPDDARRAFAAPEKPFASDPLEAKSDGHTLVGGCIEIGRWSRRRTGTGASG